MGGGRRSVTDRRSKKRRSAPIGCRSDRSGCEPKIMVFDQNPKGVPLRKYLKSRFLIKIQRWCGPGSVRFPRSSILDPTAPCELSAMHGLQSVGGGARVPRTRAHQIRTAQSCKSSVQYLLHSATASRYTGRSAFTGSGSQFEVVPTLYAVCQKASKPCMPAKPSYTPAPARSTECGVLLVPVGVSFTLSTRGCETRVLHTQVRKVGYAPRSIQYTRRRQTPARPYTSVPFLPFSHCSRGSLSAPQAGACLSWRYGH